MHPPLTLHRHPMCAEIIEEFQKCHADHPIGKFFGECTELKIKLDRCFRQEKAVKRKANFEESKNSRKDCRPTEKRWHRKTYRDIPCMDLWEMNNYVHRLISLNCERHASPGLT